jgi:predicted transcriptional regulator
MGGSAAQGRATAYSVEHESCWFVYIEPVAHKGFRLNVTLDGEHAAKLQRLAERTHVQEGTLARSLLAHALDEVDADPRHIVDVLDGIPNALDRAKLGLSQARAGEAVPLDEL